MVPQQHRIVLERFGKYVRVLDAGLNFKWPVIEYGAYHHSLKEQVVNIDHQSAITRDNVKIQIDGVLYFKITDAFKASYAISNPI